MACWNHKVYNDYGKPKRDCLDNERPKTMPSHTEENRANYDYFKLPPRESSPSVENAGIGGLIASLHHNGGSQELRFEIEQYSLSKQEEAAAMFESCINQDMCSDSDVAQEITSAENSTETSAATATPFLPVLFEEDAANKLSLAFKSLLQDHDPVLFETHAANNLSWAFTSSPQVHDHTMQEKKVSYEDTSPSVPSIAGGGLTKVAAARLTSLALKELSEGPETGPRKTSCAPVSGYVPGAMTSPAQEGAAPNPESRRGLCSSMKSVPNRLKVPALPASQRAYNPTTQAGIQGSTSSRPTKRALPTTSSAEPGNRGQSRGNSERFPCPECRQPCRDSHNLDEHMRKHSTVKTFLCMFDGCTKASKRFRDMLRHKREKHDTDVQLHKCSQCSKIYKRPDYLKKHVEKKHP